MQYLTMIRLVLTLLPVIIDAVKAIEAATRPAARARSSSTWCAASSKAHTTPEAAPSPSSRTCGQRCRAPSAPSSPS